MNLKDPPEIKIGESGFMENFDEFKRWAIAWNPIWKTCYDNHLGHSETEILMLVACSVTDFLHREYGE